MTVLSPHHMGELFEQSSSTEGLELFHADPTDWVWKIPDSLGKGYVQEIELSHGLSLVILDCELTQNLPKDTALFRTSLEFEFCLAGINPGSNLTILHLCDSKSIHLQTGQRCLWVEVFVTAPRLDHYFHCLLEQLPPKLRQISGDYFEQIYCSCFSDQPPSLQLATYQVLNTALPFMQSAVSHATERVFHPEAWVEFEQVLSGRTTSAMQTVLNQILNCPYQGMVRQTYLASKALELVALRLEQIACRSQPVTPVKELQSEDIKKIYQARDILLRQLESPPSLIALARQAGLNDCTLKRGFRQVFGMTAFECLYHYRMEHAQQLLEAGEMTVNQVATAVGYTSRSSFYKAFRKQFGVGPSEYLAQRRKNSV